MSGLVEEEDLGNYSDKEEDEIVAPDDDEEEDDNESVAVSDDDEFDDINDIDDIDDDIKSDGSIGDEGVEETKGDDNPNITQNMSYYISDEESEEEEDYLYKMDEDIRKDFISKHHPEATIHNYEEVKKLSTVVRNVKGIIVDPLHRTLPIMTKYEYTRILGQRAKQIEGGAQPFVAVEPNIIDSYLIAENELREKKIPFIIRRPIPNGGFEYWNVNDLEILF